MRPGRMLPPQPHALGAPPRPGTCCRPPWQAEVRRKVLGYLPALYEAVAGSPQRAAEVVKAGVARLADFDESVRRAALGAVGGLLQAHPELAASKHTEGRGTVVSCLVNRLRDKKLGVRRQAASQAAALVRAWLAAHDERGAGAAPRLDIVLGIPLVLCNMAVRDPELGAHILDGVLRGGLLPAHLPPAAAARYWALMWKGAGAWRGRRGLRVLQCRLLCRFARRQAALPLARLDPCPTPSPIPPLLPPPYFTHRLAYPR